MTPQKVTQKFLRDLIGDPTNIGLFYAPQEIEEADENERWDAIDNSEGELFVKEGFNSEGEAIKWLIGDTPEAAAELSQKAYMLEHRSGQLTEMGTVPTPLYDDVTHPDGSDSKIPYWVRRKLSELDSLIESIVDADLSEWDPDYFDTEEFVMNLENIRENIGDIQEGEGWI